MRNNIVFKFLAIILCAVSLLGAVGSAAGILALTEGDLYNKTVEELRAEQIQLHGYEFAHEAALHYASTVLGGFPQEAWEQLYGTYSWHNGFFVPGKYGYALIAEDGTILESANTEGLENTTTHSFPVTGQYLHLVSAAPVEDPTEPEVYEVPSPVGDMEVYDAIPPEGTTVTNISVTYTDHSSEGVGSTPALGFLYYGNDGQVLFRSFDQGIFDLPRDTDVIQVEFTDAEGNVIYSAYSRSNSPVGKLSCDENGYVLYTSYAEEEVLIYEAAFLDEDHSQLFYMQSDEPIGTVSYDDQGYMTCHINLLEGAVFTDGSIRDGKLHGLILNGKDGCVYDAWSEDGIGTISLEDANSFLVFSSDYPVRAAKAPVAEVTTPSTTAPTEVTVPPTEEETITVTEVSEVIQETAAGDVAAVTEVTEATEETAAPAEMEATVETIAAETEAATEPMVTEDVTVPPTEAVTIPPTEEVTVPPTEAPITINGKSLKEYELLSCTYWDSEKQQTMEAQYVYTVMPAYTLELYLEPDALQYESYYSVLELVRLFRNYLFPALGICLLVFAIFAVYLCCAAGRKPKTDTVHAGGLNCLPLDLYALGYGTAIAGFIIAGVEGGNYLLGQNFLVGCAFAVSMAFLACLLTVAFAFAFVAQIKTPGGYWWRNTICGRCWLLIWHICQWLIENTDTKVFPFLGRIVKKLWRFTKAAVLWCWHLLISLFTKIGKGCRHFYGLIPLTWQWLLTGFVIVFLLFVSIASRSEGLLLLCLCASFAIVLYGTHCFGVLLESTKRMSKGDLDTKVDDKLMVGAFKDFAGDLNDLADVAVVAAQKQLKSERMKTELITNVSHDIKTPLTSLINYVDLLQKPHTAEEEAQYLEVLARQSQRLKKLIDDLMEMSKANTGNMAVEITRVDAVESINQALGEFADKLDRANLTPVFRRPDGPVFMMADGRLVWRVLSNLLGNAVKYAHPGTRLYIDLMELEGKVVISLKNISREELNVDADELLERFVRGDAARNTEGSGLGLNIAKSLTEVQKGQLQILVDGDLFKVTLVFPGA